LQRDFKVLCKGLKGRNKDTPFVKLVTEYGESLTLHLPSRKDLDDFHEEVFTVKIVQEQQTIG
jgi:hypothetical protein